MRPNTTLQTLRAGGTVAGPIIPAPMAPIVEVAGLSGFDCVLIDAEHGTIGHESGEHLVRAANAVGITPLVRPTTNAPNEILRWLDMGAQGLLVPGVSTAEDARAAVHAAKYAPQGARGLVGSARSADYGLSASTAEYVARANDQILVMALLEHIDALANLDAILAVEGIDVISLGPSDLSQSMGYPGQTTHPEVVAVLNQIVERSVAAGRPVSINAPTAADVQTWRARGVRFFFLGAFHHLAAAWRGYVGTVKETGVS